MTDEADHCDVCGGSLEDGEGYGGLCGTCADRTEEERAEVSRMAEPVLSERDEKLLASHRERGMTFVTSTTMYVLGAARAKRMFELFRVSYCIHTGDNAARYFLNDLLEDTTTSEKFLATAVNFLAERYTWNGHGCAFRLAPSLNGQPGYWPVALRDPLVPSFQPDINFMDALASVCPVGSYTELRTTGSEQVYRYVVTPNKRALPVYLEERAPYVREKESDPWT